MIIKFNYKKRRNPRVPFINHKTRVGFTLVELLVVMGVALVVGSVVAAVFLTSLRSNNKAKSLDTVRRNGNYAVEQVGRMIRYARSFDGVSKDGQTYINNCSFPPTPTQTPTNVDLPFTAIWSGDVQQTFPICASDGTDIYGGNGDQARTIWKFSLPAISPGIQVLSVALNVTVYTTGGGSVDIAPYYQNGQGDPETDSCSIRKNRTAPDYLGGALPYYQNASQLTTGMTGGKSISFSSPQLLTDIKNASPGIFSLVVNESSVGSTTGYSSTFGAYSGSPNPPVLIIRYYPSNPLDTPIPSPTPIPYQFAKITNFDGQKTIISCLPEPVPTGIDPCLSSTGIASTSADTCINSSSQLMDMENVQLSSCSITCQQNNVISPPTVSVDFSLTNRTSSSLIENKYPVTFRASATLRNF